MLSLFFFFNDTATTEIYTLSLHDALPISQSQEPQHAHGRVERDLPGADAGVLLVGRRQQLGGRRRTADRKSTRLNSSHLVISYAVFCLKKKKKIYLNMFVVEYTTITSRVS